MIAQDVQEKIELEKNPDLLKMNDGEYKEWRVSSKKRWMTLWHSKDKADIGDLLIAITIGH